MSESSYPYTATDGTCQFNISAVVAQIAGVHYTTAGDEVELVNVIKAIGPVTVTFYAVNNFFSFSSGVYYDTACEGIPSDYLNHAVTAVGYGTLNGLDYYVIKNSWGTWWGDQGYVLFARNKNHCNIANWVMYATV